MAVGVPLSRARGGDARPVPGVEFPKGIDGLDLAWFERRIVSVERIVACDTPEKLAALREEALQYVELCRLRRLADGGG